MHLSDGSGRQIIARAPVAQRGRPQVVRPLGFLSRCSMFGELLQQLFDDK